MPIVRIEGVPVDVEKKLLSGIVKQIQLIVASFTELNLSPSQTTVFFPPDLLAEGLGEEIIVSVIGLFDRPERTAAVRQKLADTIKNFLMTKFQNSLIEVLVFPFDQNNGFASSQ